MEARRAAGERFSPQEALSVVVPLCTELAHLHASGKTLFVHPSSIGYVHGQLSVLEDKGHSPPALPRDRACLAPEERKGSEGDARASVFTVGAILYELLTNSSVGPGMRRPADLVSDLPPALEVILGKALVADPKHRPGDLGALAQALHQIAPSASVAPPPADQSHLDADGTFEVDVKLSLIPPTSQSGAGGTIPAAPALPKIQSVQGDGPFAVAIAVPPPSMRSADDPTQRLTELKAALESDPRPRYVVVKDGMDHGPFSAVELLQQIATGSFTAEHVLRDSFLGEERFMKDWEEFAPFAEQAKLNRDIQVEKRQFEAVVVAEKQRTQYKALLGFTLIGVFVAGAAGLWLRERANKQAALEVHDQTATAVDIDGGLGKSKSGAGAGVGGPRPAGGGSYPVLGGGMSCESAQSRYVEEYKMGNMGPADLTAGAYGNVLNRGSYLNSCGVPSNMAVSVCAAVQNGRAVGVTVTTDPPNAGISSCVAGQVRALPFPSHPRLDVARTTFAAGK
jgi:hypothetical protein